MASENAQIFLGNIIHSISRSEIEVLQNGYIIIVGAKILAVGLESSLAEAKARLNLSKNTPVVTLTKSQILIPGFVDTHIHAPQYPNCGLGYDKTLLEWLEIYTFPLEAKFSDLEFSRKVYNAVVNKSICCGTTTACYFGTIHNESCNILVDIVLEKGQRALVGKVNMTRFAPDNYIEVVEDAVENTLKFIKYVQAKKCELVKPVITPRFALSLDMDIMKQLSSIAKSNDLHIQTHISENRDEVDTVQTFYGMPYANVYEEANLLTPKTILAHAIYLTENELKLISQYGASVAHCPDSNVCLKSGACNVKQLWDYGISVGFGTDVAGGSSPSIINTMRLALYSSFYFSFHIKHYQQLTYEEVFYLATLGGSEVLSLEKEIGSFQVYKDFDALIVDMDVEGPIDHLRECTPSELLQRLIYCGDDRNIVKVYVAGKLVKG